MHARYSHEMARARAAKVRPVLLAEQISLAERERGHERGAVGVRHGRDESRRQRRAKREPAGLEAPLHRQGSRAAHVARRTVAVHEQPLLVVKTAWIARAVRRPQANRELERIAGRERSRRVVPREPQPRRHPVRSWSVHRETERGLTRRQRGERVDPATELVVARRRGSHALREPRIGREHGPRARRGEGQQRPRPTSAQREQHDEQQRPAPLGAGQRRQRVHRKRAEQPRDRGHDERRRPRAPLSGRGVGRLG